MRTTGNEYDATGRLIHGFDYEHQAWVRYGVYLRCAHPRDMACRCYGKLHAGESSMVAKEKCQRCGAVEAIYNPVMESAALCPLCARESREEIVQAYDYPNERESYWVKLLTDNLGKNVSRERAIWVDCYDDRECGE